MKIPGAVIGDHGENWGLETPTFLKGQYYYKTMILQEMKGLSLNGPKSIKLYRFKRKISTII